MRRQTNDFNVMIKSKYLIPILLLATLLAGSADWYKHWNAAGNTWYEKWNNVLNTVDTLSVDERMDLLEKAVNLGRDGPLSGEHKEIFDRAQAILLSSPGHAKYYQDKIDKMRAELLANSKKTPEERKNMQDEGHDVLDESTYLSDTGIAIRTLRFLPSAETVSVLGYFLNDPVLRDGKTLLGNRLIPGDYTPHRSNAELATDDIRQLGIEHPPFKDSKGVITPDEIDAWKDWWNEVKDGKRTYRFIGSKVEYGPDGPASKEVIKHVERDQKRDEERETGHRKSPITPATASPAAEAAKPLSITGILAACALIGAAVWYFLRGRKLA